MSVTKTECDVIGGLAKDDKLKTTLGLEKCNRGLEVKSAKTSLQPWRSAAS